MSRLFSLTLLLAFPLGAICGCNSSAPPPAPVSETEVDDLELDLEGGVETTPEQAAESTDSAAETPGSE